MSKESFPSNHEYPEHEIPVPHYEYEDEDRELNEALENIWGIAHEFHLDPFPTHFEIAPPNIINQLGSYGIPGRFTHWTFGRQYRQLKTMYDHGLSKIYELVINSNPSQAFLLENNPPIENKFVMAHVLGHTDFFKNNQLFAGTRRDMPESAARDAERIRGYEEKEGKLAVEQFLDATLAIEEHIDPYMPLRLSRAEELQIWRDQALQSQRPRQKKPDEFDDMFGPRNEITAKPNDKIAPPIPPNPDRDVLGFIRNHAPYLEEWQRDVINIVRGQSLYFYPQRRTKIMNEGWASYWHKRIMREMGDRDLISDQENESWWLVHSSVVAPGRQSLNPYYLGMTIYEYLEDYHNGNLTDSEQKWLKKENVPIPPHFEGELKDSPATPILRDVMIHNDDQSFIRNHFNKIVADRMNMYVYEERVNAFGDVFQVVKSTGWQDIREELVNSMNNSGTPYIVVVDGDYDNGGELYLRHEFDGRSLDPEYIRKTLPYIHTLWQRPLHLETIDNESNKRLVYAYDGKNLSKKIVE